MSGEIACDCGRTFTVDEAREMPLCYVVKFDDGREPQFLERRRCSCGEMFFVFLNSDGSHHAISFVN